MGLSVVVGRLAKEISREGPDSAEDLRRDFERLNEVLTLNGLPRHEEPEKLPRMKRRSSVNAFSYTLFDQFRIACAHRFRDPTWLASSHRGSEVADAALLDEVMRELTSHLLCHSDARGFYVPVDFAPVIFEELHVDLTGGMTGSSYRLREELERVAPAIGVTLLPDGLADDEAKRINALANQKGPLWVEQMVWLSLFESARLSLEHRTAICFC